MGPAVREALENEAADLFGQFVLYLRSNDIDIEAVIERKWLRHLDAGGSPEGGDLSVTAP